MKNKLQIITGVLAMYMLSLPVMLVFHSQSHGQNTVAIAHSDVDQITAQSNLDCQICSFYFDQQLFVENLVDCQLDSSSYYFHQIIVASPVVLPQEQQHLRGPPIV